MMTLDRSIVVSRISYLITVAVEYFIKCRVSNLVSQSRSNIAIIIRNSVWVR